MSKPNRETEMRTVTKYAVLLAVSQRQPERWRAHFDIGVFEQHEHLDALHDHVRDALLGRPVSQRFLGGIRRLCI